MKQQIVKNTLLIVIFSLISKALGFGREVTQAALFGATHSTDALVFSFLLLQYITGFIISIIEKSVIPKVASYKNYSTELNEKVNKILYLMLLLLGVLSILVICVSKPLLILMKVYDIEAATKMIYFIIPIAIIMSINSLMQAVLKSFEHFKSVGIVMIVQNLIIIITIFLLHDAYGIYSVLIGWLVANAINFLHIFYEVRKIGFRFTWKNANLIKCEFNKVVRYLKIIMPIVGLILVSYINSFFEKRISFGLGEGTTTMLYYGTILNDLVYSVFILSAMSVLIPALSKTDNKKLLTQGMIRIIIICFLPITVLILFYSEPFVILLLKWGKFTIDNVKTISYIFMGFSLGLLTLGVRETLYTRAYSIGNTKLPFMANLIASIVNIVANYIFSQLFGVVGLALGTTLSIYVSVFYISYYTKENYIDSKFIKKISIGIITFSSINILFVAIFGRLDNIFALSGIAVFSLLVYFITLYIIKMNEIVEIMTRLKERFL